MERLGDESPVLLFEEQYRVKSGIIGRTAKLRQPLCLFHGSVIVMKTKLTKQTAKILMRRYIRAVSSGFPQFANVCPKLPGVRIYPTLPYLPWWKPQASSS